MNTIIEQLLQSLWELNRALELPEGGERQLALQAACSRVRELLEQIEPGKFHWCPRVDNQ